MLPRLAIQGLIGTATALAMKEAIVAKFELENPALLVTLPASIIKHAILPTPIPEFTCPHRQKLHAKCSDASTFDKMTVPPVNIALHHRQVPLTKDAYRALKEDIMHAKQMSADDPMHKKISDYQQQAINQRKIADAFHKGGEREGALMHSMLAVGFDIRAGMAEKIATIAASPRIPQ